MRGRFINLFTIICLPFVGFANDLAISPTLVSPSSGCYLSSTSTVTVIIVNAASAPYGGTFTLSYSLNAGPLVTESITTFLPASATYIYSFIVKADLSACQVHNLNINLNLTGDVNPANNSLNVNVTSDCDPVAGAITFPDTVCNGINSGSLVLTGYSGTIKNWIYTNTGGPPWTWTGNTANSQSYSNIANQMQWWALVGSLYGFCPDDSTAIITIETVAQTNPGILPPNFDICDNGNGGQIDLTGYLGNVLDWEYSQDGGVTWTSLGNTTDSLDYLNLAATTQYQVLVQHNICPAVYSPPITLNLIPGTDPGILPADFSVCDNGNSGSILLAGYLGNILGWSSSIDGGSTWNAIANTTNTLNYSNLTVGTMYQVQLQHLFCPIETSVPITISVVPGTDAGNIMGQNIVCRYVNDSSLQSFPILGNVTDWIYSTDNGISWTSSGISGPNYPFTGLNSYTVFGAIVQHNSCIADTAYHSIVVMPLGASVSPDVTIFLGESVQLISTGGLSYSWSPTAGLNDPLSAVTFASPTTTTLYSVQITDINGCIDTAFVTVTVDTIPVVNALFIPNLLTPNGDGFNDVFQIANLDQYPNHELVIFNSTGQVIFQSQQYNNDWDVTFNGSKLPDGTYYYLLKLNDSTLNKDPIQGVLTIIDGG